jgi:hypothetical protein
MASPPTTRGAYTAVAATLALLLAAVALVVSLTREPSTAERRATTPAAAKPAPDSLTGAEIDEHTLASVPRSASADDAARLGGKPPSAFLPSRRVEATGLVRLSAGDSKTLLRRPPFTVVARCASAAKGLNLALTARSSKSGSIVTVGGLPGKSFGGRESRRFISLTYGKSLWLGGQGVTFSAPGGPSIAGLASTGVKTLGSDCAASLTILG